MSKKKKIPFSFHSLSVKKKLWAVGVNSEGTKPEWLRCIIINIPHMMEKGWVLLPCSRTVNTFSRKILLKVAPVASTGHHFPGILWTTSFTKVQRGCIVICEYKGFIVITSVFSLLQWTAGSLTVLSEWRWTLLEKNALPILRLTCFSVFFLLLINAAHFWQRFTCNTGYEDLEKLYCHGLFLQCHLCQMDGWMDEQKRMRASLSWWPGNSLSISISLFPTFSLSISSPPTCSHIEWGITPSHSHYLSLSISIILSATSFWPFCTNWIHLLSAQMSMCLSSPTAIIPHCH